MKEWLPENHLAEGVAELLERAEQADEHEEEDRSLPEELERREQRLAQIRQAKAMIEERADQRYKQERGEYETQMAERRADPGPPPDDPSPLEAMAWRLQTPKGKEVYGWRKATVETVFGIIKQVMGFRQFLLHGLQRVELVQCAYNLKRMHALA